MLLNDRSFSLLSGVTSSLVPLHIASDAEVLIATSYWTIKWLLSSMAVSVDLEARRSRECSTTVWAIVPFLLEGIRC